MDAGNESSLPQSTDNIRSLPTVNSPPGSLSDSSNNIIQGHRAVQTIDSAWLCIQEIYGKLHLPNTYDVGGSYIDNVPDYWFTFKTEKIHDIFLLHLFAGNRTEGTHSIGVASNALVYSEDDQVVRLDGDIEIYKFTCKEHSQSYITTYSFKESEVELVLKDKKLYIAVQLNLKNELKLKVECEAVKINHDFLGQLLCPINSDFYIESADGVKFPIHRTILSLNSDVFKAMLKKEMAESQNGCVKLVDVESSDLKIMLEYIYTGAIMDIEQINFHNVMMLADRFNISGLRKLCNYLLIDQLSPDTAIDTLVLADRFNSHNVKKITLQYITKYKEQFKSVEEVNLNMIDNKTLLKELCSVLLS